jgi:hypothetical protein
VRIESLRARDNERVRWRHDRLARASFAEVRTLSMARNS